MRKRICLVLILVLCAAIAAPVAAAPPAGNKVAIWHKGRVIQVSVIASLYHWLMHGCTLVKPPCPPTAPEACGPPDEDDGPGEGF